MLEIPAATCADSWFVKIEYPYCVSLSSFYCGSPLFFFIYIRLTFLHFVLKFPTANANQSAPRARLRSAEAAIRDRSAAAEANWSTISSASVDNSTSITRHNSVVGKILAVLEELDRFLFDKYDPTSKCLDALATRIWGPINSPGHGLTTEVMRYRYRTSFVGPNAVYLDPDPPYLDPDPVLNLDPDTDPRLNTQ